MRLLAPYQETEAQEEFATPSRIKMQTNVRFSKLSKGRPVRSIKILYRISSGATLSFYGAYPLSIIAHFVVAAAAESLLHVDGAQIEAESDRAADATANHTISAQAECQYHGSSTV